jgi:hypothetical protein
MVRAGGGSCQQPTLQTEVNQTKDAKVICGLIKVHFPKRGKNESARAPSNALLMPRNIQMTNGTSAFTCFW